MDAISTYSLNKMTKCSYDIFNTISTKRQIPKGEKAEDRVSISPEARERLDAMMQKANDRGALDASFHYAPFGSNTYTDAYYTGKYGDLRDFVVVDSVYDLDTGELLTGPPGDSFGPDSRVQPFEYGISSIGETKLYALGLAGVWNRANDYYADTLKENGIKNRDVSISYDGDQVLYKKINDEYYQKMKNDPELMNLIRDAVPGLYADLMKYKPSSSKA